MEFPNRGIIIIFVLALLVILYFGQSQSKKIEGFEDNIVTAKKLVSDDIVCNNNIITKNMHAKGDLVVDQDLHVNGNIYLKKGNTFDLGGIGMTNIDDEYCIFKPANGFVLLRGSPDGTVYNPKHTTFHALPGNWGKAQLTRPRPKTPVLTVV